MDEFLSNWIYSSPLFRSNQAEADSLIVSLLFSGSLTDLVITLHQQYQKQPRIVAFSSTLLSATFYKGRFWKTTWCNSIQTLSDNEYFCRCSAVLLTQEVHNGVQRVQEEVQVFSLLLMVFLHSVEQTKDTIHIHIAKYTVKYCCFYAHTHRF